MTLFQIINVSLAIPAVIFTAYLLGFGISAFRKKQLTVFNVLHQRKFAIVLTSCNDEQTITKTLYSLNNLVYPKNLYDVIYLSSEGREHLAQTARNLGALVVEQKNVQSHSRSGYLKKLLYIFAGWQKGYEAVVIFEKGGLVSGNYLEAMNHQLENGCEVVQSSNFKVPVSRSWAERIRHVFFLLEHFVISKGRNSLYKSVLLRGNGMCFSTEILNRLCHQPFEFNSYNDLTFKLLKGGVKVSFSAEARVWVPLKQKGDPQDKRNFIDRFNSAVRCLFRNPSGIKYAGTWFFESIPIFKILLTEAVILAAINVVLYNRMAFFKPEFWLWISIIVASVVQFLVGYYIAEKQKKLQKTALYIPVMCFWVLMIFQTEPFFYL